MSIYLGLLRCCFLCAARPQEIASRFIQAPKPFGNGHPFRAGELLALLLANLILLLIAGWLLVATGSSWSSTKSLEARRRLMESSSPTRPKLRWLNLTKSWWAVLIERCKNFSR